MLDCKINIIHQLTLWCEKCWTKYEDSFARYKDNTSCCKDKDISLFKEENSASTKDEDSCST